MPSPTLLLIRHAESVWNAARRWQGQGDPPLSALGRAQAGRLAGSLAGAGLEELWASDLSRARETAQAVTSALGLPLSLDARLRERDLGRWSGLTEPEIRAAFPEELARFRARDPELAPGGGETRAAFAARVAPALAELAGRARTRRLAVVTHLGVMRPLAPELRPANTEWIQLPGSALEALAARSAASDRVC